MYVYVCALIGRAKTTHPVGNNESEYDLEKVFIFIRKNGLKNFSPTAFLPQAVS